MTLGIDCDYRAGGSLRLTRTDDEADEHRASIPLLKADGFPMHEIAASDALPAHLVNRFTGAFVRSDDGELHPVRFFHGVARGASARGARIFSHSPVRGARWEAGLWNVNVGTGRASARNLVLATNAWAPELCPALRPLILPRRGQVLATAPLDREIASMPTYAHYGYQYWRQTPDGRLVIGGWRDLDLDGEVGFDVGVTAKIQAGIESGLAELVPGGAPIEYRWAGTMDFARDGRPLVGWLDAQHHLAICAGFTGHGIGMAAGCTLDLASLLVWKEAPGISTFDPGRFAELRHTEAGVTGARRHGLKRASRTDQGVRRAFCGVAARGGRAKLAL